MTIVEDSWLRTGDIAYFDEDGYLFIVDRIKEIIKYKGFQVRNSFLKSKSIYNLSFAANCKIGHVKSLKLCFADRTSRFGGCSCFTSFDSRRCSNSVSSNA